MASDQLQFTSDPISLLSTGVLAGEYTGTLTVDYATGAVTGSITTSPAVGSTLPVLTYSNFTESFDATTGVYTLSSKDGILGLGATTFNVSYTGMAPTTSTSSLALVGAVPVFGGTMDSVTSAPVCYVAGTLIRTPRGDVAIEALAIGDEIVTASGAHRPIKWLGHRTMDCRNHPRPEEAHPIRIAAHAFGPDKPRRDLWVSPGHAICVNVVGEVLVPASALVNGSTIMQVEVDTVTYWHAELDSHDLLLAENLAAESYLEMGNRRFFREEGVVALDAAPDATRATASRTHADFCRPFHCEGALVDVVRAQLRERAVSLGWRLVDAPLADLHLVADGVRIEPTVRGLAARFLVPAAARDVWLVSGTSRPCEVTDGHDRRKLGVWLSRLTLDDGFAAPRAIDLADPLLSVGFHHVEDNGWRWTAGRALLPAALWGEDVGGFFLRVDLTGPALPRWTAPGVRPAAAEPERVSASA